MKTTLIKATTIDDGWFQCLGYLVNAYEESDGCKDERKLEELGVHYYTIDKGSYKGSKRLEFNHIVIDFAYPGTRPLSPPMPPGCPINPPCDDDHLKEYFNRYLFSSMRADDEQYTYGERILLTWDKVMERIKNTPMSNQIILQVAKPGDFDLEDPPCLRHIDIRILGGKIHFHIYMRSWDLWAGLPENIGGFQLLKEKAAEVCSLIPGATIANSKGLHLYSHTIDAAFHRMLKEKGK
jgi:thymidylate synthase